jgi:AraC-like DNA-binding protein
MPIEPHLNLTQVILQPGGEWMPDARCWTVARMAEGFGYCLHGGSAHELKTGELVIVGPNSEAAVRATQLAEARLDFFRVVPQRLNGFMTVLECRQLETNSTPAAQRLFHYAAHEAPAQKFARLAALPERESLANRSALLQLWASCAGSVLHSSGNGSTLQKNLEATFRQFISKLSEQDLAESSMADLAAQLNCSERHLSRLFRAEFGMSFREKQTELNLNRACQLLSDPNVRIGSVAVHLGYPHVSLFNSLFKKRFGLTPKAWRQQQLSGPSAGAC